MIRRSGRNGSSTISNRWRDMGIASAHHRTEGLTLFGPYDPFLGDPLIRRRALTCNGLQWKWLRTAINGTLGPDYLHLSIPSGRDYVQLRLLLSSWDCHQQRWDHITCDYPEPPSSACLDARGSTGISQERLGGVPVSYISKQNPQSVRRNNFPGAQIPQWFLLLSENLSASNYPGAASRPGAERVSSHLKLPY